MNASLEGYSTIQMEEAMWRSAAPTWPVSASPPASLGSGRAMPPRSLDAVEFTRIRLGFTPDPKQAEVLLSGKKLGLLNCSRQWGKSTVAAAKAVYRAWTEPGSLIVLASPTERQSGELMEKLKPMVLKLGIRPRSDGFNPISLVFPNGSRIVGLPGTADTARGISAVSLLIVDEASRVDENLVPSLMPFLMVSQGDLWLLSTPFGRRGLFYEMWTHGSEDWHRVQGSALECPRIPRDMLEMQRNVMTPQFFSQEYLCEFVDNGTEVFGRDLVERAVDSDVMPLEL